MPFNKTVDNGKETSGLLRSEPNIRTFMDRLDSIKFPRMEFLREGDDLPHMGWRDDIIKPMNELFDLSLETCNYLLKDKPLKGKYKFNYFRDMVGFLPGPYLTTKFISALYIPQREFEHFYGRIGGEFLNSPEFKNSDGVVVLAKDNLLEEVLRNGQNAFSESNKTDEQVLSYAKMNFKKLFFSVLAHEIFHAWQDERKTGPYYNFDDFVSESAALFFENIVLRATNPCQSKQDVPNINDMVDLYDNRNSEKLREYIGLAINEAISYSSTKHIGAVLFAVLYIHKQKKMDKTLNAIQYEIQTKEHLINYARATKSYLEDSPKSFYESQIP